MPVADIYRVVMKTRQADQVGFMVWHMRLSQIVSGAELGVLNKANRSFSDFGPLLAAALTVNAQVTSFSWRKMFPLPKGLEIDSNLPALTGAITGDPLPPQTSGLVKINSNLPGRANRGRKYIPFPGELSSGPAGRPIQGYLDSLNTLMGQLIPFMTLVEVNPPGQETWNPVIFNPLFPQNVVSVVSHTTRASWATQRRRGHFGRPNPV